jgi:hypothetical protein
MSRALFILSGLFAAAVPSGLGVASPYVGACTDIVDQVMSQTNGRLLSVQTDEDRCVLTLLVREPGKRPQKKLIRVDVNNASPPAHPERRP